MGYFYTFTEEMRAAGLAGNELILFTVIHSYSQGKRGCYYGSQTHLANVCGCTDRTVRETLTKLEDRGFIKKFRFMDGNVLRVAYSVSDGWERQTGEKISTPEKISDTPGKNFRSTPEKISDNIHTDIDKDIQEGSLSGAPARGKFDFRQAILDLGVTPETADAWMEVRRRAKAVNSELAFRDVAAQIEKSGHSAEECIYKAAAKSWRGFEAAWMEDRQPAQQRQQPRKQENYFEANARVAEQIRRDLFKESQPYDEQ